MKTKHDYGTHSARTTHAHTATRAVIQDSFLWVIMLLLLCGCSRVIDTKTFEQAINSGDVKTVRRCIQGGIDVNAPLPSDGRPPLSHSVVAANEKIVRLLLDAGADPNLSLSRSIEKQKGVAISNWQSPIGEARALITLDQLGGKDPTLRRIRLQNINDQRMLNTLHDPAFTPKMNTIMRLLEEHTRSVDQPTASTQIK